MKSSLFARSIPIELGKKIKLVSTKNFYQYIVSKSGQKFESVTQVSIAFKIIDAFVAIYSKLSTKVNPSDIIILGWTVRKKGDIKHRSREFACETPYVLLSSHVKDSWGHQKALT